VSARPTATDLRVAIARRLPRLPLYLVAARAGLHPNQLSALLNERRPLDPKVAQRILDALVGPQ
jgi:hypothetical protein